MSKAHTHSGRSWQATRTPLPLHSAVYTPTRIAIPDTKAAMVMCKHVTLFQPPGSNPSLFRIIMLVVQIAAELLEVSVVVASVEEVFEVVSIPKLLKLYNRGQ